jgi:subtilisin family serine protease
MDVKVGRETGRRWTAVIFSLLLVFGFLSAKITADLKRIMENAGQGELIPVNIVLQKQSDPKALMEETAHLSKSERRAYVINKLRALSESTQAELLSILRRAETNGKVRKIRSLWIANVISCEATKDVIELISKRPEVKSIDWDEKRNMLLDVVKVTKPVPPDKTKGSPPGVRDIVWNLYKINAPDVWNLGYTGSGVIVAVLDTGVNYNHSDLNDHIWRNLDEIPGNGVDDDGNGYVDDYYGYNFAYDSSNPMDDNGHGTHCAGTIAGDGTAGTQTGVAPDAAIMSLKVLDSWGSGQESDVWEAIQYAVANGADVMSFSIGWQHAWNPDRSTWRQTLDNALAAGLVSSVAAGNERSGGDPAPDNIRTPGDVPPPWINPDQPTPWGGTSDVVTVGATDSADDIAYFSSFGPVTWENVSPYYDWDYPPGLYDPDVSAPGVDITSLDYSDPNGYASGWSGTSMATPHVAGVMALLLQKNPNLTPAQIDEILETSAVDLGSAGKDNDYGAGRIDALQAINMVPGGFDHDVGATQILSPVGTVPAGEPLTPRVVVWNFGNYTESFNVTCEIYEFGGPRVYLDNTYVNNLGPSTSTEVTFASFTPSSGYYTVRFFTQLSGDENPANDTTSNIFFSRLMGTQYLVWDLDPNTTSGPIVDSILMSLGYLGNYSTSPTFADSLSNYECVWVFLGIYPDNYVMESGSPEATALANYIQNGGRCYMEGGDVWYYDPGIGGYNFAPLFGINPTSDGSGDLSTIQGVSGTFTEGMSFSYGGENNWIDHIDATGTGYVIFSNLSPSYNCGVANDAGIYRTVGTSFELGGLQDGSFPSTRENLVASIMNFFFAGVPDIDVTPTSFDVTLSPGETLDTLLTIMNTGEGVLFFNVSVYQTLLKERPIPIHVEPEKGAPDPFKGEPVIEGQGGPDEFGYSWIDSDEPGGPTFNWVDITGVGTPLNLSDDDYAEVSLPWQFPFYGVNKTSVKISSNGYLTFGTDGTDYSNDPIPDPTDPNDFIAPFWDDLNPSVGGEVYYYYDSANDRFIVEWFEVPHYFYGGPYTFEAILYPDGEMLFQYLSMVSRLDEATIGIENADASIGLQVVYDAPYVHNNLAVLITLTPPIQWITVSPTSGSVDPAGSFPLTVSFNAADLSDGTYNATISISSNDPDESPFNVPVTLEVVSFVPGDANGDGVINPADLSYLANYLFFGGPEPVPLLAGDTNGDCVVNPADLSYLANYLFFAGPDPQACPGQILKVERKIRVLKVNPLKEIH